MKGSLYFAKYQGNFLENDRYLTWKGCPVINENNCGEGKGMQLQGTIGIPHQWPGTDD